MLPSAYAVTPLSVDASVVGTKPVLNVSANGVPVVQIVPPNSAGVSHNRFTQYNVGTEGQVLNNSGLGSVSVLAGSVGGNPMLGNSNARLILNEVTSVNPSALNGRIEITGKRADLVIANPNGISVDGGGFINASRAVLTTGKSQLTSGAVANNFSVQQGQISVQGKGLDARGADQLFLLSRSLLVNADLFANDLNVVTGANQINLATGALSQQAGTGIVPTVAVDVSNLGGMYANSIYLVGTEAGVGVNSKGKMEALTGDIQLSSAGDITVTDGQLKAFWDVRANAKRDMTLQGTDVLAGNNIELVSGRHLNVTATRTDTSASTTAGATTTTKADAVNTGTVLLAGGDISLVANTVWSAADFAAQRAQHESGIATLQTQITTMNTQIASKQTQVAILQAEVARLQPLRDAYWSFWGIFARILGIPAVINYDAALANLQTAQANLLASQTNLQTIQTSLQTAQTNLQNFIATNSGGKVTISGSALRSEGNILVSGADVSVNSLNDSKLVRDVTYSTSTRRSWCFWGHCAVTTTTTTTTTNQNLDETLVGGELAAWGDVNVLATGNHDAAGGLLQGTGNLVLLGANVKSDYGQAQLIAANDLEVEASQSFHSDLSNTQTNSKTGFLFIPLSKGCTLALDAGTESRAEGSIVTGNSVQLNAGRDVMVRGSVLSADTDVTVVAGRDVDVIEARDKVSRDMIRSSKESGLFTTDGTFSITLGSTSTAQTSATAIDTASASQIGSISGGVSIMGGRNVQMEGADVVAGTDIDIIGDNVNIFAAKNTFNQEDSYDMRTSGLTLALKGGAVSSLESAWQATKKAKQTTDRRLKNAYAFKAGYDTFRAVQQAPELATSFSQILNGSPTNAAAAAGVSLELGLGSSSSQSTSTQTQVDWRAATLSSNGDTTIIARAPSAGETGGKLDIMGSNLDANNLTLSAGSALSVRSSLQTSLSRETSSNTSASVGVGVGVGSTSGLYATASGQIGNSKGEAFKENNGESTLTAANQLTLLSGGDADLKGTIAKARRIEADITGNLTLASLQDSERYQYKSSNAGFSVTAPLYGGSTQAGGSINGGTQKISNQYQNVVQQSGLFAGDGGYDIKVGGTTNLIGAAIVSSAAPSLNKLVTGDLIYSDLANAAQTSVSGYTFGLGTGVGSNYFTPVPNVGGANRNSTTQSILSPGTIQVAKKATLAAQNKTLQTQIDALRPQLTGYASAQAAVTQSQALLFYYGAAMNFYRMWGFGGGFNYFNTLFIQEQAKFAQLQTAFAPYQATMARFNQTQTSLTATTAAFTKLNGDITTLTGRTLANANPALSNTFDAVKTRNTIEAMNVFSETAMKTVGDYFQKPLNDAEKKINDAKAALDAANKSGNTAAAATAQTDLNTANAAMDTIHNQQIVTHGVVGGLTAAVGGTNPTNGFVGGAVGKTVALVATDMLAKSGIDPIKNPILYNQLITLAATGAASVVGGSTGGFVASQGDRFNRQLHMSNYNKLKAGCGQKTSTIECRNLQNMTGVSSQIRSDIALPEDNVVANYNAQGEIVSYTLTDKSSNQPWLIMEPLEFQVYRDFGYQVRADYLQSSQGGLDSTSYLLYASNGQLGRAAEHLGYAWTDPEMLRNAAISTVAGGLVGKLVGLAGKGMPLVIDELRIKHIFRNADGHLPDTLANRQLLENLANNPNAMAGVDKYGTTWFASLRADGTQVWAGVRNGKVSYGGLNTTPRIFNAQTGFSAPIQPKF